MYSRLSLGLPLFAALSLCAGAQPASAAEGYLCGADTIVYVEPQDLEYKKRTDPCIASYYGLQVAAAPEPTARAKPMPAKPSKANLVAKLKPRVDADASARAPTVIRHASAVIAAPETDFRNVRVLNPETPAEAWYRHTK